MRARGLRLCLFGQREALNPALKHPAALPSIALACELLGQFLSEVCWRGRQRPGPGLGVCACQLRSCGCATASTRHLEEEPWASVAPASPGSSETRAEVVGILATV